VVTDEKADADSVDDVQAQINKMCGVDDETFKMYNR